MFFHVLGAVVTVYDRLSIVARFRQVVVASLVAICMSSAPPTLMAFREPNDVRYVCMSLAHSRLVMAGS